MLASNMERKIHNILLENNIPFKEEYIFPDLKSTSGKPLRFDFAIFDEDGDIDFLIEANG